MNETDISSKGKGNILLIDETDIPFKGETETLLISETDIPLKVLITYYL